jgi:periplasmic divalent cation tolerance protein
MIIIYCPCPSKEEAQKIAQFLLENRLIACANMFPIESMYWWEGEIAKENEFVLIGKTTEKQYPKVVSEIEKIHPYDTPCILKIDVDSNKKYRSWLENCVK